MPSQGHKHARLNPYRRCFDAGLQSLESRIGCGQYSWLIANDQLQEFGSKYESEVLRDSKRLDMADVIIYVHDSSDTNSFSYISNLRVSGRCPSVLCDRGIFPLVNGVQIWSSTSSQCQCVTPNHSWPGEEWKCSRSRKEERAKHFRKRTQR
jgi:hypothetical protein